jgi:hypothetical protein
MTPVETHGRASLQHGNYASENIRSSDYILKVNTIAIHRVEIDCAIDSAVPLEIFVGGVVNQCAPPVVNLDLKSADQRSVHFGETEIVVEAVVARGRDGIGEVNHQGVIFTERYGVGFRARTGTRVNTAIERKGQDNRTVAAVLVVEVLGVSAFLRVGYAIPKKESVAVCSK